MLPKMGLLKRTDVAALCLQNLNIKCLLVESAALFSEDWFD